MHTLHSLWRQKAPLTSAELTQHRECARIMGDAWVRMKFKSATWIHWVVAHSTYFATRYKSIYLFSSIPTERKNVPFKRDLRHCYRGGALTTPMLTRNGLAHTVNMNALDIGLIALRTTNLGPEDLFPAAKRRKIAGAGAVL